MNAQDIAALVAAGAFLLLVIFLGVPLLRLGRLIDESRQTVKQVSDDLGPLLDEVTVTVRETNKQLARVDQITENVAEVTGNINSLVAVVSSTVGSPLIKAASLLNSILRKK
ncbi:MAG: hypothetical protein RL149_189 [Actinomycetota bacterium]|jgi:uncharacterized protein YoxC